jgi:precorrin-6B methylase 2
MGTPTASTMGKRSLIDDVYLDDERYKGEPVLFTNQEIRRMLSLAKMGKDDVFYDLGCGWGQNLLMALTEGNAAKVVGIEQEEDRRKVALERLGRWAKARPELRGRFQVVLGDFEELFENGLDGATLKEATVVFYGLSTYKELVEAIQKNWNGKRDHRRVVYYYRWLFPEILASNRDHPFLVSEFPFEKPGTELEWLKSVVGKGRSTIHAGSPTEAELWDELTHDYDVMGNLDEVSRDRRRLRAAPKG